MNYILNGWTKDSDGGLTRFNDEYTDYAVASAEYKRLKQNPLTTVRFWVWVDNEGWQDAPLK